MKKEPPREKRGKRKSAFFEGIKMGKQEILLLQWITGTKYNEYEIWRVTSDFLIIKKDLGSQNLRYKVQKLQ